MFKELLKEKRKYYGRTNFYPTAIKLTSNMWAELKMEGKAINMNATTGFSPLARLGAAGSVNGMLVYIDDTIADFEFGYHYEDGFNKEAF